MAGWTNRGKVNTLDVLCRATAAPVNFYVMLITSAIAPTADTNLVSDVTEVAAGNGYTTGGFSLNRNATDFDVLTEDDATDQGIVEIKDVVWTAAGGNLPSAGSGARYAVLTDDNGVIANREIWYYWDLTSDRTVSTGQTLTLQDLEISIDEA